MFSPAPEQEPPGGAVPGVPARDQPAGPDQDRPGGPPLAAASADLLHLRGVGPRDQSDRGGGGGPLPGGLPPPTVFAPRAPPHPPRAPGPPPKTANGYAPRPPRP